MCAWHVPELGRVLQCPASGSAHEGGPLVLTQGEKSGPSVMAAKALVPGMFPRLIRLSRGTVAKASVTHPSRPVAGSWSISILSPRGR